MAVLCALPLLAQTPSFEVASVKPAQPHASGSPFDVTIAGGIMASHVSAGMLIQMVYSLKPFLIFGSPGWLDSEEWAIVAKPPEGTPPVNPPKITPELRLRLQALLADRFHLIVHHETREMPVYALVIARNGPKLPPPDGKDFRLKLGRGSIVATGGAKIAMLASVISNQLDRPVIDETGLTDSYSITLRWTPEPPAGAPNQAQTAAADPTSPSFFTALQEQLGLKLESKRRPVEVLVIDHVERASEN
jgi:uncharacterized protein (TIGR03435 family)